MPDARPEWNYYGLDVELDLRDKMEGSKGGEVLKRLQVSRCSYRYSGSRLRSYLALSMAMCESRCAIRDWLRLELIATFETFAARKASYLQRPNSEVDLYL